MYRYLVLLSLFVLVAGSVFCVDSVSYGHTVSGIAAASVDILTAATTGKTGSTGTGGTGTGGTGTGGTGTGRTGTGAAYGGRSGYGSGYGYSMLYYYLVTSADGSMEYAVMTISEQQARVRTAREAYKAEVQQYNDLRKQWVAAFPKQPFPIDKPVCAQYDQKNTCPTTNDDARAKWDAKHEAELERYVVCVITNKDGSKAAEAMRMDKVAARKNEMNKDYVEAALAEAAERKGDPDAAKLPIKTKRAELKVGKKLLSQDAADKLAAKLQEKIDSTPESEPAETTTPSEGAPSGEATPSEDAPSGAPDPSGGGG